MGKNIDKSKKLLAPVYFMASFFKLITIKLNTRQKVSLQSFNRDVKIESYNVKWKNLLTQLHQEDSSTTTLWTGLFPTAGCLVSFYYYCRVSGQFLLLLCFIKIPVINANI